jgi:hypothetical protein
LKQVFNEEAIAFGFRCSEHGCHYVAAYYDEEGDRVLCEQCKPKAEVQLADVT